MSSESELYADSAQARELDRRHSQRALPIAELDSELERANNERRLAIYRASSEARKASSKALVKRGIAELEAFFCRRSE